MNSKIEVDVGFWNLLRAYLESSIVEFEESAIEETRISLNDILFVQFIHIHSVTLNIGSHSLQ